MIGQQIKRRKGKRGRSVENKRNWLRWIMRYEKEPRERRGDS